MNNKFNFLENNRSVLNDFHDDSVVKTVHASISKYLGFNVNQLIEDTDAAIFGGAVRDSIAKLGIYDVDIMALPFATRIISERLINKGFYKYNGSDTDTNCLYQNIHVIHEPWTFIKDKISVQIIRPAQKTISRLPAESMFPQMLSSFLYYEMMKLLLEVDISACGVIYSNEFKPERTPGQGDLSLGTFHSVNNEVQVVKEICKNAIVQCQNREFEVRPDKRMHQLNRILNRIEKLEKRGWKQIKQE